MANKAITVVKTAAPNTPVTITPVTAAANDVFVVPCNFKDEHTFFIATAATATTIEVQAGDGYAAVNPETIAIPAGTCVFTIDSARFKNLTGDNKGKVLIKAGGAVDLSVAEARV